MISYCAFLASLHLVLRYPALYLVLMCIFRSHTLNMQITPAVHCAEHCGWIATSY